MFDHIANISFGYSLAVLDITRFESLQFLNALLGASPCRDKILVMSCEPVDTPFKVKRVDLDKLHDPTDLSIEVDRCRRAVGRHGILIHHYLPHIIVKEGEELVLRMIEYWLMKQPSDETAHFFTLPQATFPFFEKKLQALVSGVISINVLGSGKGRVLSFQILRTCRPEFHMEDFPFIVDRGRLLIKWGDTFTDTLPSEGENVIKERVEYLKANFNTLKITRSSAAQPSERLSTYDRWLLSQIMGWTLTDVGHYFPESINELLRKLAVWNLRGLIKFEPTEPKVYPQLSKYLRLRSRFALALPTRAALLFLKRRHHTIPMKVYHALRRSVQAFISERMDENDLARELSELETYFQDMTARSAAIETYRELGQDPSFIFNLKYLPKLVSLAMYYGYALNPKIQRISDDLYEIEVRDCFICSGVQSESPVCQLLVGTIVGCCSICYKDRFACNEVKCKASGDKSCIFYLRRLTS
ncbi:hypothetical protein KEJ51_03180 [Candidatus Bathyarchaeota archaeon]|nr:hypothetical protein [Candidatus Bathyarchaeota archaeon]